MRLMPLSAVTLALPESFAAALNGAFMFLTPLMAIQLFLVPRLLARVAGLFLLVGWAVVMAITISSLGR